jgi:hypothetical protein
MAPSSVPIALNFLPILAIRVTSLFANSGSRLQQDANGYYMAVIAVLSVHAQGKPFTARSAGRWLRLL